MFPCGVVINKNTIIPRSYVEVLVFITIQIINKLIQVFIICPVPGSTVVIVKMYAADPDVSVLV